ncbi:hypothetical protein G3488_08890 [Shewanella baltica]|uniref:hypothetical protein n=1 Tax=Shewanella baltica TaxID=62322 RepID=UPI00217D765D|nr:hypothetical protein [Shewanella baltica]MCS6230964.1 hypothetical protein [Shewanella baltica]
MTEKTSVKKMTKHALNEHEKFGNDQGCLAPSADDIDLFSYAEKLSEEMREKKVKFRLNYSGKDNFFLPSLNECIEFIVGMSLRQALEVAAEQSGRPLPFSRSGWFAMFSKGVGYPTAKKFLNWMKPSYEAINSKGDALSKALLMKGATELSSAGDWLSLVGGMRASEAYQQQEFAGEYSVQFDFIIQRCDAHIEMVKRITYIIENAEVDKKDSVAIMRLMRPYWEQFSLVPKAELLAYENGLVLHAAGKLLEEEPIASLMKSYCYLHLDFYLHLFASYEVGCIITYGTAPSELNNKKGLLCRAITRFSSNECGELPSISCFGEFLEEIRDVISKNYGKLSHRKMAKYIPMKCDPVNPSSESESDRCYNTLKAWKKGKDIPSQDTLERFLDNLTQEIGPGHNPQLILMGNMALGIDKSLKSWCEQLTQSKELTDISPLIKAFLNVVGRYELYYKHHLELQFVRLAGVETSQSI